MRIGGLFAWFLAQTVSVCARVMCDLLQVSQSGPCLSLNLRPARHGDLHGIPVWEQMTYLVDPALIIWSRFFVVPCNKTNLHVACTAKRAVSIPVQTDMPLLTRLAGRHLHEHLIWLPRAISGDRTPPFRRHPRCFEKGLRTPHILRKSDMFSDIFPGIWNSFN